MAKSKSEPCAVGEYTPKSSASITLAGKHLDKFEGAKIGSRFGFTASGALTHVSMGKQDTHLSLDVESFEQSTEGPKTLSDMIGERQNRRRR